MGEKQEIQKATHQGELQIADNIMPCAVLEDGTRIISQAGFLRSIGRSRSPKAKHGVTVAETPTFLSANNLKPYISNELIESTKPIIYKDTNNRIAYGYKAEMLPQVCEVFLKAKDDSKLRHTQKHIAMQCDILVRSLAKIGIIALVDEATGYQEVRDRLALAKILDKYIRDEYRTWTRTFPPDFYKEMFRLKDWPYDERFIKRPSVIGHYTNDIVYSRLAPGVLTKLREKNPPNPSVLKQTNRKFKILDKLRRRKS